ncbi:Apoptosis-inducing factor 1, mitochondrial, partial [Actinomortierella ambigua]
MFRAALRASRLPRHSLAVNASTTLRRSARTYASHAAPHPTPANNSNSDTLWVIYKLTAPPPRKKAAADHHPAPAKQPVQEAVEAEEAEAEEAPAAPKYEKDFYPYVLIGAGTASFAAMEAIREKDPSAAILIIGNEDMGPYMRPPLSKEMWFNKDEATTEKLSFKDWQGKERNIVLQGNEKIEAIDQEALDKIESAESGVKLLTGRTVSDLNIAEQTVTLDSGK